MAREQWRERIVTTNAATPRTSFYDRPPANVRLLSESNLQDPGATAVFRIISSAMAAAKANPPSGV